MKKNLLIAGALCMLSMAGLSGCATNEESTPSTENTVNDAIMRAREFLEFETGEFSLPDVYLRTNANGPATRADKKFQGALSIASVGLEPDWERASHWKYKGDRVTEVPAVPTTPVSYFTLIEERGDTVSLVVQEPYTRIRVIESPNGKEISGFVITLLPNENYTGEIDYLNSNPEGSDYTGISLYSDLDGTPLWGWRYTDGEIVNTLLFSTDYEDLPDLNVRVLMGFGGRSVTRAQDNAIEIDPVTVTGKRPDNGDDAGTGDIPGGGGPPPSPNNPSHFGNGGGGSGSSGTTKPQQSPIERNPTVKVPSGFCVAGSIAAALQVKFGYDDDTAIAKAEAALKSVMDNPYVFVPETGGINVSGAEVQAALESLGFKISNAVTSSAVATHFNNGGFGIGHFSGNLAHNVFLTGYNSSTNKFSYYDSVTGGNGTGTPNSILLFFN